MFGEPILVPPSSISLPADPAVVERRVLPVSNKERKLAERAEEIAERRVNGLG